MAKKEDWIYTYTGRKFSMTDPQPEDIHIIDIAHALSLTARYGGHSLFMYSVAQHSVYAANIAESFTGADIRLEALLHDASEAYIGDVPSPFKAHISNYREIEDKIMAVIADKYGFSWPMSETVKAIDTRLLGTEARQLLPGCDWIEGTTQYSGLVIERIPMEAAERMFITKFQEFVYGK